MLHASKRIAQGQGLAQVLLRRAATLTLDWDLRQKSRFDCHDGQGRHIGVFLPRGTVLRGGDVLVAENGDLLHIRAAAQPVLRIQAHPDRGSPFDLVRAAYHLGNRHVPIELQPDHLKIEPDHVLADMVRQMGLLVTSEDDSFEPEAGAYGDHGASGHSHQGGSHARHHEHAHDCRHDHPHGHAHDASHEHDD